jgi:hypothetical protein
MFLRVAYEQWHDIVPYIAFGVTAMVFLTMTLRALFLSRKQAEQMSHLPLDD